MIGPSDWIATNAVHPVNRLFPAGSSERCLFCQGAFTWRPAPETATIRGAVF
jgi:hypothetical protein